MGGEPVEVFDIEVEFVDPLTASQENIVTEAVRRWESAVARGPAIHLGDDMLRNPIMVVVRYPRHKQR